MVSRQPRIDVPNGRPEAERLISLGILPTHTIVLNDDDNDYEDEGKPKDSDTNIVIIKFNEVYNDERALWHPQTSIVLSRRVADKPPIFGSISYT